VQVAADPRRVDVLVEGAGRRNEAGEVRYEVDYIQTEPVDGHRSPALIVAPPHPDAFARLSPE
jgi:hypothetical protein